MDLPLDWQAAAEQAKQAAEQGRWDLVRKFYDRRAAGPVPNQEDASLAAALVAIDRIIEARLTVARRAAAAALEDASSARRILGQWRAKLQAGMDAPATVSRRV